MKSNTTLASSEVLVSTLFYLMSRYAVKQDRDIASTIEQHLNWLTVHPDYDTSPLISSTCQKLIGHWQTLCKKERKKPSMHSEEYQDSDASNKKLTKKHTQLH